MKLIVGLGNPDKEYINTRHNIGFGLIDYIYKNASFANKFNALYKEEIINSEKNIIIKPLSYMNLSGIVVRKYVDYYKIKNEDILVIQDDLDMALGKIKFVFDSSSGGHNGIKNIEDNLGTKKILRLKIGISNDKSIETRDYVLGNFNNDEIKTILKVYEKLKDIFIDFNNLSVNDLMNKYNNKKYE